MTEQTERGHAAGLGLPVLLSLGFVVIAPVGFFALPLAAMIWSARPGLARRLSTAGLATGLGVWWLLQVGDPSDQLERTLALLASVVFVGLTFVTRTSVTHRSLATVTIAAAAGAALMMIVGRSWESLRWWVEHRIGYTAQVILSGMWAAVPRTPVGIPEAGEDAIVMQAEEWLGNVVPVLADLYPGMVVLQLLGGLALAALIAQRLGLSVGRSYGPEHFTQFRFSEHLGWIAVLALGTVLLVGPGASRVAAANVLLVTGALYGLRGAAVAWFGLKLRGGPGVLLTAVLVFSIVFLLPAVVAWTIVVGVADTGLDLRKRWVTPQVRN